MRTVPDRCGEIEVAMDGVKDTVASNWSVERLITPARSVSRDLPCEAAFTVLCADASLPSLAVVEGSRPCGLISRQDFFAAFAQPLVRAVYERRTVERLMCSRYGTADPLIVESTVGIEELKEIITTAKPRAVVDGFIITRNGEYAGIGSGVSLLALSLERARGQITELEDARFVAQRANQAKSTFLASISHELRTPLNAVIGFSEILQKQYYGALNDKQSEYVGDILRSGTHLLGLINDILDLSKAEAGKLDLREDQIDLNNIVTQAMRMLRSHMEVKGISASIDLPYHILRVLGDPQKLKQVAINLLANAVKFTPAGGQVSIAAMIARDGAPSLIVSDTGIGISPEEMERVLKPFERAESQATLALEGTGIGLPLSKAIVERHGGTLHLTSELGRGTTVIVRLPPERLSYRGAAVNDLSGEQRRFYAAG
jgi:two-component system cell cycle sensor histidine kinase PleC